jgi:hypothetical protein
VGEGGKGGHTVVVIVCGTCGWVWGLASGGGGEGGHTVVVVVVHGTCVGCGD